MTCNPCIIRGIRICLHLTPGERWEASQAKAKRSATEYRLLDQSGREWAIASLSATRLNALIREYKRQGIFLTAKSA